MARLVKTLLIVVASVVGIAVLALVAVLLFFDPNDYREQISGGVRDATGRDLPAAQVNYTVEARVFDNPECESGMTEAEFADFSRTVVPVRITGPLASPTVRPDIEAVFRQQVEGAIQEEVDKLKDRFLNRLLGGEEQSGDDEPAQQDEEQAEDFGEQLKNKLLKDLIGR